MKIRGFLAVTVIFSPIFSVWVFADAGSALREYKDATTLYRGKSQPEKVQYQEPAGKQESDASGRHGGTTYIETINVVGNTILTPEALWQILAPYTGRELSTQEIHEAANEVLAAIRAAGAFTAKVYVLPQNIEDKTITFDVIEGHLAENGIVLEHSSERVKDEVLQSQLVQTLEPGTIITAKKYERAIYLTNDLPGIKSTVNHILPAENVGEAAFMVAPEDEPLVTGSVDVDNFGSKVTGHNRSGAVLQLNSPTGHAEQITVGANVSNLGTVFGYVDTSVLLYPNGLRGGITLDHLDYKTDERSDLRGTAMDGSLYLHYPIIRSRLMNLYTNLQYTYTTLEDDSDLGEIDDRVLNVGSLKLYGDMTDGWAGGGVTTAEIEGYFGDVDLGGYQPYKAYDALHADTQGEFTRLTYGMSRLQQVYGDWQAYAAFNGQIASKRMDPSQSIAFGGPYAFPGYEPGEIFGDDGWMIHGDLRYNVPSPPWHGDLQVSVFYDYGRISTHTAAVVGGFEVPGSTDNSFAMQTTGLGFSQSWENIKLQGVLGWKVDNEIPSRLLSDKDESNFQGWIELVYGF